MKKIFLKIVSVVFVSVFILSGCKLFGGGDDVDNPDVFLMSFEDYTLALENFNSSSAIEYFLESSVVNTSNQHSHITTINDKVIYDASFKVLEYSSTFDMSSKDSLIDDPVLISRTNTYYKDNNVYVYFQIPNSYESKSRYEITYENYLISEQLNNQLDDFLMNFEDEVIENCQVSQIGDNYQVSFEVDILVRESFNRPVHYQITAMMDSHHNLTSVLATLSILNLMTATVEFNIIAYNSDVVIDNIPNDLNDYVVVSSGM